MISRSVPDTWVTDYSGEIGNTLAPNGEGSVPLQRAIRQGNLFRKQIVALEVPPRDDVLVVELL
jgi:hypothetical protein